MGCGWEWKRIKPHNKKPSSCFSSREKGQRELLVRSREIQIFLSFPLTENIMFSTSWKKLNCQISTFDNFLSSKLIHYNWFSDKVPFTKSCLKLNLRIQFTIYRITRSVPLLSSLTLSSWLQRRMRVSPITAQAIGFIGHPVINIDEVYMKLIIKLLSIFIS